jgi:hypothetical protein
VAVGVLLLHACVALGSASAAEKLQMLQIPATTDFLIRPDTILIHNATGGAITFSLTSEENERQSLRLGDNETRLLSDGTSTTYVIDLPTLGRGSVQYRLKGSKRYQLYWNESAERWDVTELAPK